jgi:hypothetical protein
MTFGTSSLADSPRATTLPPDAGFDARWAAWVARGEAHDRRVRRKLVVLASALALGAALFSAFMYAFSG